MGSVNPFRGSSNYAYAIEAPKTVGGLQPALSVEYSSAAADLDSKGRLGRGWDMELSRISRVYKLDSYARWVPSYVSIAYGDWYWANSNGTASLCDQYNSFFISDTNGLRCGPLWKWDQSAFAKLDFGATPLYILTLNGQTHPLVHVGGEDSGEYVARDYSLMRIRQCNLAHPCIGSLAVPTDTTSSTHYSKEYWQVFTPDGARYVFGTDDQSEQVIKVTARPSGTHTDEGTVAWYLRRVYADHNDSTDSNNHKFTAEYAYTQDHETTGILDWDKDIRLASVVYGDSSKPGRYRLDFAYQGGSDNVRLSSVKLFKVGSAAPERETDFTYYSAAPYDNDLQSLQVKAQGQSLPAITFSYTNQPSNKPVLLAVDNGYGGRTEYEYEAVSGLEKPQRRVTKEWTKVELSGVTTAVGLHTFEYGSTTCVEQAGTSCYSGYTIEDSKALVGHDEATVVSRDPASNAELGVTYAQYHLDLKRLGRAYLTEQRTATARQPHGRTVVNYAVFEGAQAGGPGLPPGVWFTAPTTQTAYPNVTGAPDLFSIATTRYTGAGAWQGPSERLCFLGQSLESDEWGNVTPAEGATPYRHQETAYAFTYDADTGRFLLRPASAHRYDGATLVTEVLNYYDGSATSPGTLTRGDLTQAQYTTNLPTPQTISLAMQYDASGRLTQQTMVSRTATIQYDTQFGDFVVQVTDAAGTPLAQITGYEYYGLNESVSDGSGPFGALKAVTDPNGQSTQYAYDVFGRLIKVVKPGDAFAYPTESTDYGDVQGVNKPLRVTTWQRVTSSCAACVHAAYVFYDGLGRALQTKSETQSGSQVLVSSTDYDPLGRVRYQSVPEYLSGGGTAYDGYTAPGWGALRKTETRYDTLGRPYQVIGPDGSASYTAYREDAGGMSVATLDANGHKRIVTSDVFGRLEQVQELTGTYALAQPDFTGAVYATTRYGYDGRDNLTVVTDTLGNTTAITYDGYGRKTSMDDPDMGHWTYAYDPRGNLQSQTDAKGQTLWFAYDALDRLTQKRMGGAEGTLLASFAYDQSANGIGRRTQATSYENDTPYVMRSWGYDARGRAVTETAEVEGQTFVMNYAYDAADRVTGMTYPADEYGQRETVTSGFDDALRPVTLTSSLQPAPYVSGLAYNPLGQATQTTFGAVLTRWNGYYGYDTAGNANFGQLYQTCVAPSGQGPCIGAGAAGSLFKLELGYDAVGNITNWQDQTPGRETALVFGYDPLDRLTSAATPSGPYPVNEGYGYDPIGNLTQKGSVTQSYPAPGALHPHAVQSRSDGGAFQYDANGNMTQRAEVSGTAVTTYMQGWTVDNRLAVVTDTAGGAVTTYRYDADGNRIRKNDPDGETLYPFDQFEWHSTILPVAGVAPTGTLAADGDYAGLRVRQRGDYGVVTFTAQADTHLSLHVGDLYQTPADYWVHAPDGTLLATARTDAQGPDFVVDPNTGAYSKLTQSGTYTVTVKPRDNRRGRYNLLMSSPVVVSSTLEMRTLATAMHTLAITRPAQDGLIEFYGQAGRDIAVDLLQASNPVSMTLYRPDGSVVVPPLGSMAEVMPLDATGVYTLRVNPLNDATGTYQLRLIVLVPVAQQAIATHYETACRVTPDGGVACWGSNVCRVAQNADCAWGSMTTGLLGVGDMDSSPVPMPITLTGTRLVTVTENVGVGELAACAIDHWGLHHCWGLGWGYTWGGNIINVPTVNDFHLTSGLADVVHGEYHVCALGRRGDVYCGGSNIDFGTLGIGNLNQQSSQVMVQVADAEMAGGTVALASDYLHTCAILKDDRVKCWGDGNYGKLGNSTFVTGYAPIPVQNLRGVPVDLALANNHSCALMADGSVSCWGDGVVTPTTVLNQYLSAVQINSSEARQCLRDANGVAACWGSSQGFDSLPYPWPVIGFEHGGASYVAAAAGFVCIARSASAGGGYACWGKNNKGQLGDGTYINRDIPLTDTVEPTLSLTGAPVVAQITRTAETIRLAFEGTAGGQYALRMLCPGTGAYGPSLYMIGPDQRIATSVSNVGCLSGWGVSTVGPLVRDGRVVIEARPYLYGTGVFTFSVVPRIVSAGEWVVGGAPVSLNIAETGQTGQLTITGALGQLLNLGVNATGASKAYVTLYGPDGTTLGGGYAASNAKNEFDYAALPSTGVYTVTLVPDVNGTGIYTLTLSSPQTGALTFSGASVSSTVERLGQDVRLTFEGSAGQLVNIGAGGASGSASAYITVLKPDGTGLSTVLLGAATQTDIDTAALPATGTYTVVIDPYASSSQSGTGTYSVTLSAPVTGALSVNGATVNNTVARAGQDVRLTFEASAG
jgi:YD repeat-containing protein